MKEQAKAVSLLKDSEIKQEKIWSVQEPQIPYVQHFILLRKEVYSFLIDTVGIVLW